MLAQCELTKSPPLWWLNVNKQICVLCAPVCVSFGFHLIAVLVRGWNPGGGGSPPLSETLCIVGDFDVVTGLLTSGQQKCLFKV